MPPWSTLIALLVALIPTTIGALLSAIGIAGMDRLVRRNVLALSGRAVEASGDVRRAAARQDRDDHARQPRGDASSSRCRASRSPSWPRRRRSPRSPTRRPRAARSSSSPRAVRDPRARARRPRSRTFVPFSAETRMSGVDFDGNQSAQGRRRRDRPLRRPAGRPPTGRAAGAARPDRPRGRHAAGGRPRRARARRRLPQGHRQGGDAGPLRPAAARWGSRRSWSPATTGSPRRRSPRRPGSTTSSPKRPPSRSWS